MSCVIDIFFFKQKTAYGIRLSLVRSEMCMRGRVLGAVVPASMAFGMCGTCPCRDTTKLVTPVTCMPLGSLCNPCDLVDGLLNTHIDTMHAAQSTSDYRTRQQQTNVLASIVVPKSQFLDPIDDSDYIEWKEDPYSACRLDPCPSPRD